MSIPNYDTWKLSSGQDNEKVFCHCDQCGGEIYIEEEYFLLEDDRLHSECVDSYTKENVAERMTATSQRE